MSKIISVYKRNKEALGRRVVFLLYWLQNLLLFLWCFAIYIFRGKAEKLITSPKNILIMQTTTNLGDMVCTTPLFHAIKQVYPAARVYVLGTRKNKELLEGNTDVDVYIEHAGFFALLRRLRSEEFDFGCVVTTHFKNLALLYLAGVKRIAAPVFIEENVHHTKAYQLLKRVAIEVPTYVGTYVPREHMRLLEPLGIVTDNTQKHLSYRPSGSATVAALFKEHGVDTARDIIVAIEVGAGQLYKQWPLKRYAAIANYVAEKHAAVCVLIGGPGDRAAAEELLGFVHSQTRVINAVGQTIDELKALLAHVTFIIANDSGPVYIAESFGTATMVLVGPTNEVEHPPQGLFHRVVLPEPRGNIQMFSMLFLPIDEKEALAQMARISVARVEKEIDSLIAALAQKPIPVNTVQPQSRTQRTQSNV